MERKVTETLWRAGNLRWLLRRQPTMVGLYDRFVADETERSHGRIWFASVARQSGKSYLACVLALQQCIRKAGSNVKYASVDGKMARAIVFPQMEKLLGTCPDDMLPQFRSQDGLYYFPHNGSRLVIAGVDKDNVKKLRGQTANLCIVDEAGFMPDLQKVVQDVLLPQTTTTRGRLFVASTPPDSAGHYSAELYNSCKSRGASAEFTIWDNNLLSETEKDEIVLEYGGRESTRFRREYEVTWLTDATNAIAPEFTQEAEREIVRPVERPSHFDTLVSLDGGFADPAGCLFAHVDHQRAKLVIEDEWLGKECLTADVARAVGEFENRLWGQSDHFWTVERRRKELCRSWSRRIMDTDPEKAADFKQNHGMDWTPAQKGPGSLQVSVNALNSFIRQRSIEISPKCVNLIRQLHNATWAGRKTEDGMTPRRTFSRNHQDGHFDLVAALIYMLPFVDFSHNPAPETRQVQELFYDASAPTDEDDTDAALTSAFRNGY